MYITFHITGHIQQNINRKVNDQHLYHSAYFHVLNSILYLLKHHQRYGMNELLHLTLFMWI